MHPNLGNRTSLHSDLRTIGKKLLRYPNNVETFDALVRGLVAAISNNPSSKRRRRVSLGRRVGALLRTYCAELPPDVRKNLRLACKVQLKTLEAQLRDQQQPIYVNERFAALMLGVTVADLKEMVRDPETRRRLGYPRPLGDRLFFLRAALDANTAAEFFEQLPEFEPWPRDTWPKDWR
jgi:hypothetical protein